MFSITDEQIYLAERRMLSEGQVFDAQRREVIKCTQSVDVLACPGSGKTTALVAKLLIIAEQLPLKSNRGICVLTHTNVAIDTITRNIGGSARKLFSYPNFFGTIQSFVDRYLAIPAFVERYGKRPEIIDNDWYHAKVDKQFRYLKTEAKHFCHKSGRKDYPRSIRFCDLKVSPLNKCDALGLNLNNKREKQVYYSLVKLKCRVLQFGVLSYDDAYYLASEYLAANPSLTALFSKRFPYVFIDEMQDTDSRQISLLNRLFDEYVVIQRIGDINQAIFSFHTTGDEECQWNIMKDSTLLEINGSKRCSNAIAAVIAPICLRPQALTGNPEVSDIAPTIIAFDDININMVIPRFGDLIFDRQLHELPSRCFKAIGWTGKPHPDRHTISSYWQLYEKEVHTKRMEYSTLMSYIQPQGDEVMHQRTVNYYRKAIIRALLKCLRIADRPTTPLLSERALFAYISNKKKGFHDDLKLKLAQWCLVIHKNQSVLEDLVDYIRTDFSNFFGIRSTSEFEDFLTATTPLVPQENPSQKSNIYVHRRNDEQIEITVCTIHAAKGETHTATLYLETFYYDYDIARIVEYLKGKQSGRTRKLIQQNLRMAYVGMSRPSHLLCVAVHNSNLSGHSQELRAAGWEIDFKLVQ